MNPSHETLISFISDLKSQINNSFVLTFKRYLRYITNRILLLYHHALKKEPHILNQVLSRTITTLILKMFSQMFRLISIHLNKSKTCYWQTNDQTNDEHQLFSTSITMRKNNKFENNYTVVVDMNSKQQFQNMTIEALFHQIKKTKLKLRKPN